MMEGKRDYSIFHFQKEGKAASYKIYQDSSSNKYGIRNLDNDITIIKCVFDSIYWLETMNLVVFTLNGKQAFCRIEQITKLKFSRR